MKSELIENRLIVWNISDSKKLFSSGYYGKPIGISKPKPNEIDVPLILLYNIYMSYDMEEPNYELEYQRDYEGREMRSWWNYILSSGVIEREIEYQKYEESLKQETY